MSDEEEESSLQSDDSEEEEERESESLNLENKDELIKSDIATIKDIFVYIDQTSKRITERFVMIRDANIYRTGAPKNEKDIHDMNRDAAWLRYENLDETQRAELLEKAMMVLASDN